MLPRTLILIDLQAGFDAPSWGRRSNPNLLDNVERLLRAWRARGAPLLHVRHDSQQTTSPLRPGQCGHDFMPQAKPWPNEGVLAKTVNSAFIGTDLDDRLRQAGATRLLLAGLTSDHCVSTTARMAANLGYDVCVVHDAVATFPRQGRERLLCADLVHDVSLASLNGEFATLVSTCAALNELESETCVL